MAKTIQIRNVPERVHRTLRARAAEAGKSLSDYMLEEIERIAARPRIVDVLRRAGERGSANISAEEIVAAIHEGREERDIVP